MLLAFFFSLNAQVFPCSIIMASKNGKTLVGNNGDFLDPETNVWFIPASEGKHGCAYFGYSPGFPMGGVNDRGLFFECPAAAPHKVEHSGNREIYKGNLMEKAMEECETVEEVLKLLGRYDLQHIFAFQVIFVDRTGDSAIIEGDAVIRKKGDYQVVTNFRQSLNEQNPYSIERYVKAETMLKNSDEVSVELFRSILAAIHQESGDEQGSPTQYSKICDLRTGDIYLYHFHNYADVAEINLYKELQKGKHSYEIRSLFPQTTCAFDKYYSNNTIKEPVAVPINPSVLYDLVGDYEASPLVRFLGFSITQENGKLFGRIRGFSKYELIPESDYTYYFKELKSHYSFIRDDDGKVNSLVFDLYGIEKMPAKK